MKKTIVITGATSGLGLASASILSDMGNRVIGIGRNPEKCRFAEDTIRMSSPEADITYLVCDLSVQTDIRKTAENLATYENIDVLINNAATVSSWFIQTRDGIELQFAVNHLAHFLLTHLLMKQLSLSHAPRIINVSSRSHRNTVLHWDNLMMNRDYGCLRAYKRTKLCNVLFTHELNRRLIIGRAYSVDPGLVKTEIGLKNTSGFVHEFWENRMKKGQSPEEAADTIVFLSTKDTVPDSDFSHYKYCRPLKPSRNSLKIEHAGKLWTESEKYCGLDSRGYGLGRKTNEEKQKKQDN